MYQRLNCLLIKRYLFSVKNSAVSFYSTAERELN